MKSKTVISVILAMTLASGGIAFAQPNGRNDRWRDEQVQRGDQRDRHGNNGRWSDRWPSPTHVQQLQSGRAVGLAFDSYFSSICKGDFS